MIISTCTLFLILGNCDEFKDLVDKVVADLREFSVVYTHEKTLLLHSQI